MSENKNDGGPAYPSQKIISHSYSEQFGTTPNYETVDGMSLRDYFAAKAMQSILSNLHEGIRPCDVDGMCRDSYGISDAMIKEREK